MHMGIILDGNRRFAKKSLNNSKPWEGHEAGARKVEELLGWIKELNIKETTLYCFSTENFGRTKAEVSFLIKLFKKEFRKLEKDERIEKDHIKIRFAGRKELLDKELQQIIKNLEKRTKNQKGYALNFAISYGGRQEILSAIKKMIKRGERATEKNLQKNLWVPNDLDLIIRAGSERRTSNFMPWQSIYSEWIFLDKLWPEITKQDLKNAISEFKRRKRNFGK